MDSICDLPPDQTSFYAPGQIDGGWLILNDGAFRPFSVKDILRLYLSGPLAASIQSAADSTDLESPADCESAPWPTRWTLAHSMPAMCGLRAGVLSDPRNLQHILDPRTVCVRIDRAAPPRTTLLNSRLSAMAHTSTPITLSVRGV